MKKIKIVIDPEKGPIISHEGFEYIGEVIMLLNIGAQVLQDQMMKQMKSNLVRPSIVAPFQN